MFFSLVACDNDHVKGLEDDEEEKKEQSEVQEKNESENAEVVKGNIDEQEEHKKSISEDNKDDEKYLFETLTYEVREDDQVLGTFTVDIRNLREEHQFQLSDHVFVEIIQFYPDYYLNEEKEPDSLTKYPFNPAFIFEISKDDSINTVFVGIGIEVLKDDGSSLKFELVDFNAVKVDK